MVFFETELQVAERIKLIWQATTSVEMRLHQDLNCIDAEHKDGPFAWEMNKHINESNKLFFFFKFMKLMKSVRTPRFFFYLLICILLVRH